MAQDKIGAIVKNEIVATFEQLLGASVSVEDVIASETPSEVNGVIVNASLESTENNGVWEFFVPSSLVLNSEFLMLGGVGEPKEEIDEEAIDAIKEIISNICGSVATSVSSQGFESFGTTKLQVQDVSSSSFEEWELKENSFNIKVKINDGDYELLLNVDESYKDVLDFNSESSGESTSTNQTAGTSGYDASDKLQLSDEAVENLKLLFDIKLKLSVRLGTKIMLLKDVLDMDLGSIIELEEMANEPLDLLINGVKVGEADAVIVENKFGIKIRSIGTKKERLSQLQLG